MADETLNPAAGTGAVADATGNTTAITSSEPAAAVVAADPAEAIAAPLATDPTTPAVPDTLAEFEKLFPKDAEPAAAVVDPNAPAAAVPEEITRALAVSEYVKDASHLENAVRAADEVFQVQLGKIPAHQMLEGFRAREPQQFEKIVRESLIPYIEHLTGLKLGGAAAAAADPMVTMQQELDHLKGQPQRDEEQRVATANRNEADTLTRTHVEDLITKGTGIFDGATDDAITAMAAQLKTLGIDANKLMAGVRAGATSAIQDLERAYKAAEKAEMAKVKTMGIRLIARSKQIKAALPPGKGNPAPDAVVGELPANATREQMVAYLKG